MFEPKDYISNDDYEQDIVTCLKSFNVDLVVLAGYMKLVGDPMLQAFEEERMEYSSVITSSFKGLNTKAGLGLWGEGIRLYRSLCDSRC